MMNLELINGMKKKVSMKIPRPKEYHSIESYNALRANLLFKSGDARSVAMVGCESEDGTSCVTWNLALSLAEIGRKVLVIDADMRNSVIAENYQIKHVEKGLSEYLSEKCDLEECIYQTSCDNLYAVYAGKTSDHPSELLSGCRFRALLDEAKEEFDYILVDCPPLANVIDGAIVAGVCDASVIVAEADRTKRTMLQSIKSQLEKADSRILGVVLNKFDSERYKCYGNYYGKSYGRD